MMVKRRKVIVMVMMRMMSRATMMKVTPMTMKMMMNWW